MENPYAKLIDFYRNLVPPSSSWALGTVKSAVPLRIALAGELLEPTDLLCAYPLLYSTHPEERLQAGDKVALLPSQDEQHYLVLCKVVS